MKKIIILIIALLAFKSYGQRTSDYVILTFISETKKGYHGPSTQYWITQLDSITHVDYSVPIYPTYLNVEYTSDCLTRCCKNEKIDLLTSSSLSEFDYPDGHIEDMKSLLEIVTENKVLVQKIKLNWTSSKLRQVIKVYATPIAGNFCECEIYGLSLRFASGRKKVLIPNGSFSVIPNFWKTEKADLIRDFDYSHIEPQNTL